MSQTRRRFVELPNDRHIDWRQLGRIIGPAIAILVVFGIWALQPDLVEVAFTHGFGLFTSRLMASISGLVPFSLAEWIEGGVILWVVLSPIRPMRDVVRGTRQFRNAAASGMVQLLTLALLCLVVFYGTWGLNYARHGLIDRQGWDSIDAKQPLANLELLLLADELVGLANTEYLAIHGVEDAGVETAPPTGAALERAIEDGWVVVADELDLSPLLVTARPPTKPLLSSRIFSHLGISGFYFPFTGEANYNAETPGYQLPHTIAHEKAHQRGIASEDEANFHGFLACIRSPDPTVRYAGYLFAQRRLLHSVAPAEPQSVRAIVERRLPGVQHDVTEARQFWRSRQGKATHMSHAINDAYLRANRVRGGIESYALSTELIVAWARERGLRIGDDVPAD
jgi:hypothetical protein